jgi:ribonucleoside-diphosphate reductase alpha chain
MELAPEDHVRVQAAVQRWTDSAISKTCNAPENYTIEQTKKLYELMYDLGCKGGTIYRDGSRDEQILAVDSAKLGKDAQDQIAAQQQASSPDAAVGVSASRPQEVMSVSGGQVQFKIAPRERPNSMSGITYKMNTAYGHLYVTINEDQNGPFEVFASLGKTGGFFSAQTEAITRMISLALRSNVAVEEIIDQLKGIRGPDVSFADGEMIFSLPDAVGKLLERHIKRNQQELQLGLKGQATAPAKDTDTAQLTVADATDVTIGKQMETVSANSNQSNNNLNQKKSQRVSIANMGNAPVCATCGNMLIMAEGCMKCESCGYSKCG